MSKIGFIGAGNMGSAMIAGLVKNTSKENVIFTDISPEIKENVIDKYGIEFLESNAKLVKNAKYIILAIKPQVYTEIMEEIKELLNNQIVISITPGFTIETMKKHLGDNIKVVRAMPNTPSLVGEGMNCISFSDDTFTNEEKMEIEGIFSALGKVEIIPEKYMDAVVPISGSSPAYVYLMIEAMADAGVKTGLPRNLAYKLASQSILGSAKMVLETRQHPGELKDAVCSPAGTTIEAVSVLEKRNFRNALIEAMIACYNKTQQII
ncbi:pyrroline-5-carboxylate reductase [Sporosalibacterium faouarense]|uniref:pyrroline-5-carboxylate reductase n=1 Tax=Sporosalibacterium faouarense TaxID=516123 RepID=UPI00141CB2D7|nr:pyrroline-5-carboxylate reductase [Sporosalibacterium faouarense]MTI47069.1 pyrroline-5-carboxylate reductase [Bacillota bacterium]